MASHDSNSTFRPTGTVEGWPIVLENAYALYLGNGDLEAGYLQMVQQGQHPDTGWRYLTGQPVGLPGEVWTWLTGRESGGADFGYVLNRNNVSLEELDRLLREGQFITLGSLDYDPDGGAPTSGYTGEGLNGTLYPWHVYVLDSVDINARTVRVRSTWEWNAFSVIVEYDKLPDYFNLIQTHSGNPID